MSVTFANPLTLVASVPGTGTVGDEYSATLTPRGGNARYTWNSVTGVPPGVTANESDSGVLLLGQPSRAGSYTLTVTFSDTSPTPQTLTETYPITINLQSWTVTAIPQPFGQVGTPYPETGFHASNGVSVTWSASGLPPGLSLDPVTGILTGTPTRTGSYSILVTATETTTGATKSWGPSTIAISAAIPVPSDS